MNTRTILCGLLVLTSEFCHAESQIEQAKIQLRGNIKTKGRVVSGKHKIRYVDLFSIRTMQEQVVDQITGDVRDYVDYVHPYESITWSEFRPTKPIESPVVIYGRSGNIK